METVDEEIAASTMVRVGGIRMVVNYKNELIRDTSENCMLPVSMSSTMSTPMLVNGLAEPITTGQTLTYSHPSSLLKAPYPPPLIPLRFQNTYKKQVIIKTGESLLRKAVETDARRHQVASAPSAIDLPTVIHANRSLVYRKPVTTKDTASTTSTNAKIVELTGCYQTSDPNCVNFIEETETAASNSDGQLCELIVEPAAPNIQPQVASTSTKQSTTTNYQQHQYEYNQFVGTEFEVLAAESGNDQFPQIQQVQREYCDWEKVNDPLPVGIKSQKMNEIIAKVQAQKRSRAKSTFAGDLNLDDLPSKLSNARSNDSLEIINLDELPEKTDQPETRVYRTATPHDFLYNMIKSDAKKALREQGRLPTVPCSSKHVQISNGQSSDAAGPIRILEKGSKPLTKAPGALQIARIQSQNAAISSLSIQDKVRKLKESIETKETVLNWLENGDEKSVSIPYQNVDRIKRTYGRSKSISAKARMHFKIGQLTNPPPKLKKCTRKPYDINHDQDWQTLTSVLASNVPKSDSSGKNTPSDVNNANSRATSPMEIEQYLQWNTNKTLGQLPMTPVIFQRNEFGMAEMDSLAMAKIKAMKSHKSDYKQFPQFEPSMACGHPDFAGCFDAIVQRLNGGNLSLSCKVNDKKPHQYFSTEFKEIIGSLVQKKNNNCHAINTTDIVGALSETNMFDRTKNSSHFSWTRFIDYFNEKCGTDEQIQLAPSELFTNSLPKTPNTFEIGQKLEAIDPQNSSLFCVCTIVDKCGYRIKLRFDGYPATYDFWVNADSANIFPAGWCSKTGRELEVNRRFTNHRTNTFQWKEYLRQTNTQAAHRACFPNLNTARTQMNPFKIGMKLEAEDTRNTNRLCVATIGDVIDSRILVTLDGFDSSSNYWTDIRSPYIRPIDFHVENGYSIMNPPNWRLGAFSWESYLRMNRAEAVPKDSFHTREPRAFTRGMALEVVDKNNPSLIRPAVVTDIQDYLIKVLFIGWPKQYAYWIEDDSCDIFPPGYCKKTGHPIECPLDEIYEQPKNNCGTQGCRGIGNGKRSDTYTHTTLEECPYEKSNWSSEAILSRPSRVDRKHKPINSAFNIGAGPSRKVSVNPAFEKAQVSLQPTLNPSELAAMSSKDVEIFRRLQVSANFLLDNRKALSEHRNQWIDRLQPFRSVQVLASEKNPLNWSRDEVATFVSQLPNCSMLGTAFIDNDIDGTAFLSLRQNDMIDNMGMSIGSAIKVFNRIVLLREECNTHYIRYE